MYFSKDVEDRLSKNEAVTSIARDLGLDYNKLLAYANENGLRKSGPSRCEEKKEKIKKLYIERETPLRKIALELGIPQTTLRSKLHSWGIIRTKSEAARIGVTKVKRKYESRMEKDFAIWCERNNITYISQFRIPGFNRHAYDFFLPDLSLIVEIDGSYWHCLGEHSSKPGAKERHKKDRLQSEIAVSCGYSLCRFVDTDYAYYGESLFDLILQDLDSILYSVMLDKYMVIGHQNRYGRAISKLFRSRKVSDKRRGKYDPSFRGFVLDDHHKYRHDVKKEDIDAFLLHRPTPGEIYSHFSFSRNCLKRVAREFYGMGFEDFVATYCTVLSEKGYTKAVDLQASLVDMGVLILEIPTPKRFLGYLTKVEAVTLNQVFREFFGFSRNKCLAWIYRNIGWNSRELHDAIQKCEVS